MSPPRSDNPSSDNDNGPATERTELLCLGDGFHKHERRIRWQVPQIDVAHVPPFALDRPIDLVTLAGNTALEVRPLRWRQTPVPDRVTVADGPHATLLEPTALNADPIRLEVPPSTVRTETCAAAESRQAARP